MSSSYFLRIFTSISHLAIGSRREIEGRLYETNSVRLDAADNGGADGTHRLINRRAQSCLKATTIATRGTVGHDRRSGQSDPGYRSNAHHGGGCSGPCRRRRCCNDNATNDDHGSGNQGPSFKCL